MAENRLPVAVERLPHALDLPLPAYATAGAAGVDLLAAEAVELAPDARAAVPTGIRIALPEGYEAQVRPRSGLALRHGLTLLNSPGTIDCDYRGEIRVILANLGTEPVALPRGTRIAQLVLTPVIKFAWSETAVSPAETARGEGGFGSTDEG